MTGWLWGIGGLAALVLGWFLKGKVSGWPVFNRKPKTIEKDIKELEKEKEVEDADIEARRRAALDSDPFD